MVEKEVKKPKVLRSGVVKLLVWENNTKDGEAFNTISIERIYKDKEDNWSSTSSLRPRDLIHLKRLVDKYFDEETPIEVSLNDKKE